MKWILTVALLQLTVVFAVDYVCPDGKSKKSITIKKDQSFLFDIAPGYGAKSKCGVVYKPQKKGKTRCKKIKFSCTTFDLPNKSGPPKCKKGDKLKVGKQFFCKTKAPEVESTKPIKLMFLSDKKDSSGVATCSVMCADSATTTPPPSPTTAAPKFNESDWKFSTFDTRTKRKIVESMFPMSRSISSDVLKFATKSEYTIDVYCLVTDQIEGFLFSGWQPTRTSRIYIPETNTMCELPQVPEERRSYSAIGQTVCGGIINDQVQNTCKALNTTTGQWETSATFQPPRWRHCSWLSSKGLYLMGGIGTERTTTLIHNSTNFEEGFQLKNPFREACAFSDPDTDTVITTGGWWQGDYLAFVTRYNVDGFVEELPQINIARNEHGCSSYLDSEGNKVFIIYGGYTSRTTTETITLDVDSAWTLLETSSNPPTGGFGIITATLKNEVYAFGDEFEHIQKWDSQSRSWNNSFDMTIGFEGSRSYAAHTVIINEDILQWCTIGEAQRPCLDDGYSFFNGKCYKFIEEQKSWDDGRKSCQDMGGELVAVVDSDTKDFVASLAQGKSFWTSGIRVDNGWEWSTGENWSYSNWRTGEPSNTTGENCVMINWNYGDGAERNGLFNDLSCNYDRINYMCQNQRFTIEGIKPNTTCGKGVPCENACFRKAHPNFAFSYTTKQVPPVCFSLFLGNEQNHTAYENSEELFQEVNDEFMKNPVFCFDQSFLPKGGNESFTTMNHSYDDITPEWWTNIAFHSFPCRRHCTCVTMVLDISWCSKVVDKTSKFRSYPVCCYNKNLVYNLSGGKSTCSFYLGVLDY